MRAIIQKRGHVTIACSRFQIINREKSGILRRAIDIESLDSNPVPGWETARKHIAEKIGDGQCERTILQLN